MEPEYKQLAKITDPFLGFETGHGIFTVSFTADYGDGRQSVGNFNLGGDSGFAGAFIRNLLQAVGVNSWDQLDGAITFVILDQPRGRAIGVEAPAFAHGGRFVFDELAGQYRGDRDGRDTTTGARR